MKLQNFTKFINQNLYNDLCVYLSSGPIVVMILEGNNAIILNRKLVEQQIPKKLKKIPLGKLYGLSIDKNSVHGLDLNRKCKKRNCIFFQKLEISKNFNNCFWESFML